MDRFRFARGPRPINGATASSCGGDTVRHAGTAHRHDHGRQSARCPRGRGLTRAATRAGDELWVSGTVGDGALGLRAARGQCEPGARASLPATATANEPDRASSESPRQRPMFRRAAGGRRPHRRCFAPGALPLSAIAPLSAAARRAVAADPRFWSDVLGGGDDYESLFAAPPRKRQALLRAAEAAAVPLTRIGSPGRRTGVQLTIAGRRAARHARATFTLGENSPVALPGPSPGPRRLRRGRGRSSSAVPPGGAALRDTLVAAALPSGRCRRALAKSVVLLSALMKPVGGSPFALCHSAILVRVRGPNTPSAPPASKPRR